MHFVAHKGDMSSKLLAGKREVNRPIERLRRRWENKYEIK